MPNQSSSREIDPTEKRTHKVTSAEKIGSALVNGKRWAYNNESAGERFDQ